MYTDNADELLANSLQDLIQRTNVSCS